MAKNNNLNSAQRAKNDEFYTQLADIERELCHYEGFFRGKSVLCNCDDPYESNFFKFFANKFNTWGLRKLTCTCYKGSPIANTQLSLFEDEPPERRATGSPHLLEVNTLGDFNGDSAEDLGDIGLSLADRLGRIGGNRLTRLKGDGDYRSAECLRLMDEADVVVTNPPFSLFRDYVATLMAHGKKFLIIGNQNAAMYKEIFPLIMTNKLWLGWHSGDMAFTVPDYYEPHATRYWEEDGVKWRSQGNICWFTNLDHRKRHDPYIAVERYSPESYPKYDNYDAIEVSKSLDIPKDYAGVMGVPITFLDRYNPEQFEIIGVSADHAGAVTVNGKTKKTPGRFYVNGQRKYERLLIRWKGL